MIQEFLLIGFIILFPFLMLYLEQKLKVIRWISPIVICYFIGILTGNLPGLSIDAEIAGEISKISVSLAIPLLLFNSNILEWIRYAGKTMLSYLLSIVAVVVSSAAIYFYFSDSMNGSWQISGMLVGVYTGGTPNMSAIGIALDTPEEVFVILNSSDVFLGAIYFLFLITIGRRALGLFLPSFNEEYHVDPSQNKDKVKSVSRRKMVLNILLVLLLGIGILGFAAWVSILIKGSIEGPWVIMIMTTLGIAVSFIKPIQTMKGSYETAHYFLLVFSLSIGMLADLQALVNQSSSLFTYTAMVMIGAILIHYLLAALFRIDRDTVIITSTAAIYGPAFIGPVANAIQNKKVIVSGITMGLLGYAVGNYLGIGVAMLLK